MHLPSPDLCFSLILLPGGGRGSPRWSLRSYDIRRGGGVVRKSEEDDPYVAMALDLRVATGTLASFGRPLGGRMGRNMPPTVVRQIIFSLFYCCSVFLPLPGNSPSRACSLART